MFKFFRQPVVIIALILAVIPFFWLPPGTMDLGGDGGRLYFFDPYNFIQHNGLYYANPYATGVGQSSSAIIPLTLLLLLFKMLIHSSYVLISLYNGIKLVGGFISMYLIIRVLLQHTAVKKYVVEAASILGGLFYLFNPAMYSNYNAAFPSHDQVFLNPLMFYLLLRFVFTRRFIYMWFFLLISLLCSHVYTYWSAPPFFAFYPISIVFILIYVKVVAKKIIPWKMIGFSLLLFIGIHAFHLIPEMTDVFDPNNIITNRIIDLDYSKAILDYFFSVLGSQNISHRFLAYSPETYLYWLAIIFPVMVILGFIAGKNKSKTLVLTGIFFLLIFYLSTAKITNAGITIYTYLYYLPGFSMFRNFYGQWQYTYYFYYAMLFGQAVYYVFQSRSSRFVSYASIVIAILMGIMVIPFLKGELTNRPFPQTQNVKIAMAMDPVYERVLSFIRSIKNASKMVVFPLSDYNSEVIHGTNNGAYVGIGLIGRLTGMNDFAGYHDMKPYSDTIWEAAKRKDFATINRSLGLLNIRYALYNSNPNIYDGFPGFPYGYSRTFFPDNQKEYADFVYNLSDQTIFKQGTYAVNTLKSSYYLPRFYSATQTVFYDLEPGVSMYRQSEGFIKIALEKDIRAVFIEKESCEGLVSPEICNTLETTLTVPTIKFQQINPTKYKIYIEGATGPYILILSQQYNKFWKLFLSAADPAACASKESYFDEQINECAHSNQFFSSSSFETITNQPIADNSHFIANAYANAWYITPDNTNKREHYELIVEMTNQRTFYISIVISALSIALFIYIGIVVFKKK